MNGSIPRFLNILINTVVTVNVKNNRNGDDSFKNNAVMVRLPIQDPVNDFILSSGIISFSNSISMCGSLKDQYLARYMLGN